MTEAGKKLALKFTLIALAILAVYGNTLNHRLVWDDIAVIVENPLLEDLGNIPRFFLAEDRFGDPTGYYRPMTYLSFALERALWGVNPVGYNVTNIVLHIAAAWLLYLALTALFQRERLAFAAALLFALHPIAGETVNFQAGGRNTLLCAVFFLAALYLHLGKRYAAALACFSAAIFSKEFALLLPVILFIHDRQGSAGKPQASSAQAALAAAAGWRRYLPYLGSTALYLAARGAAVEQANFLKELSLSSELLVAPYLVVQYLANMAAPIALKSLYSPALGVGTGLLCLLLVLALAAAALMLRQRRELSFSIWWFLIFLLPVINLIPLPSSTLLADRYAYFSAMGFCLALAYFICLGSRRVAAGLLVALCFVSALTSLLQNGAWKDEQALFSKMIQDAPDKALGYHNLGRVYYDRGDLVGAQKYLAIAASKEDVNARMLGADALVFWEANRLDQAASLLRRKTELMPEDAQGYIMLSRLYGQMGEQGLAAGYREKARRLFPGIEEMLKQRVLFLCREGEGWLAQGNLAKAGSRFKEALLMDPACIPALIDLGSLSAQRGELAAAERYFSRAIALDPLHPPARYNLSMVYELMGRTADAQREMNRYRALEQEGARGQAVM